MRTQDGQVLSIDQLFETRAWLTVIVRRGEGGEIAGKPGLVFTPLFQIDLGGPGLWRRR